jgi:hypothetical protein
MNSSKSKQFCSSGILQRKNICSADLCSCS